MKKLNEVQRLLTEELPHAVRSECQQIQDDLILAAGAPDEDRVQRLVAVKDRAVAANCRPAVLSALRTLALEYATRLQQEDLERTKSEFEMYGTDSDTKEE